MRLRHAVGQRDHHQRPVPEVFVLVVLHQPVADAAGLADICGWQPDLRQLAQLATQHFDNSNDVCCDLSHPYSAQVIRFGGGFEWLGERRSNNTASAVLTRKILKNSRVCGISNLSCANYTDATSFLKSRICCLQYIRNSIYIYRIEGRFLKF